MAKVKLTRRNIDELKPAAKEFIVWDTEVTGFGLKMTPAGKRSFLFRFRTADHKPRKPKIGDYPDFKPERARELARDWFEEVRRGGDPSASRLAKRANRANGLIEQLFEDYLLSKKKQARKSVKQIEQVFRHNILPTLGKRKAEEVKRSEVTALLDVIEGRSLSVAGATRRQLSAFYKWAMPRLPDSAVNPVLSASRPAALKARDRVLSHSELKTLWQVLETESDLWRTALRLLVLTGQRREEVLSADWSEFDLAQKVWTIAAPRSKTGKAHIVPLSVPALSLLKALPERAGPIFPVGTGLTSRAAKRIREAMGDVPAWRWHDLRRTMATEMQRLGVRLEVTEAVLGHTSGSRAGIVGVYQRHEWAEEKREALNIWAKEVGRIVKKTAQPRSS